MKLHTRLCAPKAVAQSPKSKTNKIWAKWKKPSVIDYEDKSSKEPTTDRWIPPRKEERRDDRPQVEITEDRAGIERKKKEEKKPERGVCIIGGERDDRNPFAVDYEVDISV